MAKYKKNLDALVESTERHRKNLKQLELKIEDLQASIHHASQSVSDAKRKHGERRNSRS